MSLRNPQIYIDRLRNKFPEQYIYLALRNTDPVHIAFHLINLDVTENQVPWNKCMDCGQPYVVSEGTSDGNFCSDVCMNATEDYLGIKLSGY